MKKKQYKTPKSIVIVLGPEEFLEGIVTDSNETLTESGGSPWDDDETKGATWEDAMW